MRMTLTEVKRIEKIEKKYKRKFAYNKKKRKYGLTSFKRDFQSITIQMAKNQMLPLNNEALSGVCGSLKCCLAFENDAYFECRKNFPRIKSKVVYNNKEYQVVDFNCISEKILISNQEERLYVSLAELKGA